MKTIRMLSNEVGADGESLEAGSVYSLNDASADRWLRRGKAEEAPEMPEARDTHVKLPPTAAIETTVREISADVAKGGLPDADAPRVPHKPGPKPKAAK